MKKLQQKRLFGPVCPTCGAELVRCASRTHYPGGKTTEWRTAFICRNRDCMDYDREFKAEKS